MPHPPKNVREFNALVKVVEHLRGPNGCPWDKEQTHASLTQYAIEEVFEMVEAIDLADRELLIEELGDVLLQVVLHSEIARQDGNFDIHDVIETVNKKLIRRHPHVFDNVKVKDSAEVLKNWQEIKAQEKAGKQKGSQSDKDSGLGSIPEVSFPSTFDIPVNLPALLRAQKIGSKTKKHKFDWTEPSQVVAKIEEELGELKEALCKGTQAEQQHELGDLLFSVAQLARHLNFDAEQALRKTNQRFEKRFFKMQEIAEANGQEFTQLADEEKERLWQKAKSDENMGKN